MSPKFENTSQRKNTDSIPNTLVRSNRKFPSIFTQEQDDIIRSGQLSVANVSQMNFGTRLSEVSNSDNQSNFLEVSSTRSVWRRSGLLEYGNNPPFILKRSKSSLSTVAEEYWRLLRSFTPWCVFYLVWCRVLVYLFSVFFF